MVFVLKRQWLQIFCILFFKITIQNYTYFLLIEEKETHKDLKPVEDK